MEYLKKPRTIVRGFFNGKTVYAKDLGDRTAGVQESMELDLNLAAGNYQYGLTIGNQRIVRKMVVVK